MLILKTSQTIAHVACQDDIPPTSCITLHPPSLSTIKYQATTATLDKSWWDVHRRLVWSMCVPSLIFACQLLRTWSKTDFSSPRWHWEFYSFPFNSRAFDLSFATVSICHLSEKVDGCYCTGGLKSFPTAGGGDPPMLESLQSTGRLWPSGLWEAEHESHARDILLVPALYKHCTVIISCITILFSCPSTKHGAGNLTVTSLHSSRVSYSFSL